MTIENRWTTTPDGQPIDARYLTNVMSERNVMEFGAVGDGTTDDTAAIQAAVNLAALAGGCIFFPAGTFLFTHLTIPTIVGQPNRAVTVKLRGSLLPAQAMSIVSSGGQIIGGTILKSTATSGSIIAAGPAGFNSVTLVLQDIILQATPTSGLIAVNARNAYALETDGLTVWTGVAPFDITSAPPSGSIAIATPANNNAAFTKIRETSVCGFFVGYELSEHADVDYSSAWKCVEATTFPGGNHPVNINRLGVYHCQYGMGFTAATRVKVAQLAIEHAAGGWAAPIADVYDPSNFATGEIEWHVVLEGTGWVHTFMKTGGANVITREIGSAYAGGGAQILTGSGVPTSTPSGPAIYFRLITPFTVYYWDGTAWH